MLLIRWQHQTDKKVIKFFVHFSRGQNNVRYRARLAMMRFVALLERKLRPKPSFAALFIINPNAPFQPPPITPHYIWAWKKTDWLHSIFCGRSKLKPRLLSFPFGVLPTFCCAYLTKSMRSVAHTPIVPRQRDWQGYSLFACAWMLYFPVWKQQIWHQQECFMRIFVPKIMALVEYKNLIFWHDWRHFENKLHVSIDQKLLLTVTLAVIKDAPCCIFQRFMWPTCVRLVHNRHRGA